jgi:hypothetical protein
MNYPGFNSNSNNNNNPLYGLKHCSQLILPFGTDITQTNRFCFRLRKPCTNIIPRNRRHLHEASDEGVQPTAAVPAGTGGNENRFMLFHLQMLTLRSIEFDAKMVINSVHLTIWKRRTQTEPFHALFFI